MGEVPGRYDLRHLLRRHPGPSQAAPGAQAAVKELIHTVAFRPAENMREYTAETIARRRASDEGREGMSAFLEKRKPRWQTE